MGSLPNKTLYFAYGSNLSLSQMKSRCPDSVFVGKAVLPSHRWVISPRGYANVLRSQSDSSVYGIVYSLSDSDESWLDIFEGVGADCYDKFKMEVYLYDDTEIPDEPRNELRNGRMVKCLVYVDPRRQVGSAREEYIDRINAGLKDAMLPAWWVDEVIRPFIPATSGGKVARLQKRFQALEAAS